MRSFWSEPFLWIHFAGLAVVPIFLELVWIGLAIGDPILPFWLELFIVGAIGILPILWMQWTRPFDIFSLLIIALKPDSLTVEQQKILSLFKKKQQRPIALLSAILMGCILWQLDRFAPLAMSAASLLPQERLLGLLIASVSFLLSNLFFQIPMSVLGVFLVGARQYATIDPYTPEKVRQSFTIPGFRVRKILPSVEVPQDLPVSES
ncbi:conserved hypothetical protein [Gloeothece citriformis PCC 7424]|uniref:Low-complexity tail membrane protein n=1 Tax=Gloeothece citriformis (strain PCC 7424) TaxID=65393 RepID=B7KIU1_GLOC7|nr:low-complexity tail membrane protein [Gloeothece citriformis]ACK70777.1 conserved hypothetical protein [Gloeothece citriformis PCC 7424]